MALAGESSIIIDSLFRVRLVSVKSPVEQRVCQSRASAGTTGVVPATRSFLRSTVSHWRGCSTIVFFDACATTVRSGTVPFFLAKPFLTNTSGLFNLSIPKLWFVCFVLFFRHRRRRPWNVSSSGALISLRFYVCCTKVLRVQPQKA